MTASVSSKIFCKENFTSFSLTEVCGTLIDMMRVELCTFGRELCVLCVEAFVKAKRLHLFALHLQRMDGDVSGLSPGRETPR